MKWPTPETVNLISAIGSLLGGLGAGIAAWFSYWSVKTSREEKREEVEKNTPTIQFHNVSINYEATATDTILVHLHIWNLRRRPLQSMRYIALLSIYNQSKFSIFESDIINLNGSPEEILDCKSEFPLDLFWDNIHYELSENTVYNLFYGIEIVDTFNAKSYTPLNLAISTNDKHKEFKILKPLPVYGPDLSSHIYWNYLFFEHPHLNSEMLNKLIKWIFTNNSEIIRNEFRQFFKHFEIRIPSDTRYRFKSKIVKVLKSINKKIEFKNLNKMQKNGESIHPEQKNPRKTSFEDDHV